MRYLILLAVTFANLQAKAADAVAVQCLTADVADAGYALTIRLGGPGGSLVADLKEITLFGEREIAVVPMTKRNQLDGVEYVDTLTNGGTLALTIDYNRREFENHYRGFLTGLIDGRVIPGDELPGLGDMSCAVHQIRPTLQ